VENDDRAAIQMILKDAVPEFATSAA
jgi:hypothetical protein